MKTLQPAIDRGGKGVNFGSNCWPHLSMVPNVFFSPRDLFLPIQNDYRAFFLLLVSHLNLKIRCWHLQARLPTSDYHEFLDRYVWWLCLDLMTIWFVWNNDILFSQITKHVHLPLALICTKKFWTWKELLDNKSARY